MKENSATEKRQREKKASTNQKQRKVQEGGKK
jgi:hypothetical protein